MPLAWRLTEEIKGWLTADKLRRLNQEWRRQGGGHPDQVIDDVISMLERPNVHYEALLGYLETQQSRQQNHALLQEYHGLYSWFVELVYFRQVNNPVLIGGALRYYEGIRALVDANVPLWVFSLNHDVLVEMMAARWSIPIHYGFSDTMVTLPCRDAAGQIKGHIRAQVLKKDDIENRSMRFPNPRKSGIYLLKIHGALDMFTFNEGEDLLKLLPNTPGEKGVTDVLRAANEDLFYPAPGTPRGRFKTTNEINYMDEQGVMQFLRRSLLAGAYKFHPNRSQVLPKSMLRHFRENLNFVTNLICIGYSFGDLHINTAMREWLEATSYRHLEIVAPDDQQTPQFLLHVAPQVTIRKATATDYLDSHAGIVRSMREKLGKKLSFSLRAIGEKRAKAKMAAYAKRSQDGVSRALDGGD
jgi:hypothetical protein